MPQPLDSETAEFVNRLQRVYPQLPRLFGPAWPAVEAQLQAILSQLIAPSGHPPLEQPVAPVVVRAQVLRLLNQERRFDSLWRGAALRGSRATESQRAAALDWLTAANQPQAMTKGGLAETSTPVPPPLLRYTDLRCPGQVSLGREFQVTVRLTLRPNAESRDAQNLSVAPGKPVTVEIDAPAFVLTEGNSRSLAIPDDRDSDWAVFGLKPRQSGPVEVRVRFWQGSSYLGQARCDLLVVEHPVAAQTRQQPALPLAFGANSTPPKRILCISLRGESLHFSLHMDGAAVEIPLPPVDLRASPIRWMQRRYAGLSALAEQAAGGGFDPSEAAEDVKELGNLLWNDLIPENLQRLWLDEQTDWACEPLLIVSDEAHIPWELVWPNVPGIDAPWGVHGPLSRWLGVDSRRSQRAGPSERLTLTPWAGIFPGDSDLGYLADEAALLRRLLLPVGERTPASLRRGAVLDLLAGGECGWLHAGTHGLLDPGGEAEGAALRLEGGEHLQPEVLVRTAVLAGLRRSRPGVFWNICHGGAGGWALTGVGGWAGRLIDGGASLFLSPQWTVTDRAALAFSESFYSHLTGGTGAGVAVAAQQARLAARELSGDPSWLAYALYAHPNARV